MKKTWSLVGIDLCYLGNFFHEEKSEKTARLIKELAIVVQGQWTISIFHLEKTTDFIGYQICMQMEDFLGALGCLPSPIMSKGELQICQHRPA